MKASSLIYFCIVTSVLSSCGGGGGSVKPSTTSNSVVSSTASVSSVAESSALSSSITSSATQVTSSSLASSITSQSSIASSGENSIRYTMIPTYESLLPVEPSLPTSVCATLHATLQQSGGLLLDSVDANPANSKPDSARIQAAINSCPAGQAVRLVTNGSNNAFLVGPIAIASGVTLWVDAGVTLFASRSPADYDTGAGNCGDALSSSSGCNTWITATNTTNSGLVGDGIVDGRGGAVLTSGHHANKVTWWDLAIQSKSSPALSQVNPRMIQISNGSHFTFYKITIQNAPKFHIGTSNVDTIVAWDMKILTPTLAYSVPNYACAAGTVPVPNQPIETISTCFQPELTKNTDGFDPGTSKNVTLAYSFISVGDDDVAIKSGGSPSSLNHRYAHNRFFYGHGMSIGSETDSGVDGIKIWDLVVDGMDNNNGVGLRIKTDASRGGEVMNVSYDKVCMRRVKEPMVFSPYYSSTSSTAYLPNIHNITLNDFHYVNYAGSNYNAGTLTFSGFALASPSTLNPLSIALNNVVFDTAPSVRSSPYHDVQFSIGSGTTLAVPSGTGISTSSTSGPVTNTYDCSDMFMSGFPSANSPMGNSSSTASSSISSSSNSSVSSMSSISSSAAVVSTTWGFDSSAYATANTDLFQAAYDPSADNGIKILTTEAVADGIHFYSTTANVLRYRPAGSANNSGTTAFWNTNGSFFTSNSILIPDVGQILPSTVRTYMSIPVKSGTALTFTLNYKQTSSGATAGKIALVGSDGTVLAVKDASYSAASAGETITLALDATQTNSFLKIIYGREGVTSGGININSIELTQ